MGRKPNTTVDAKIGANEERLWTATAVVILLLVLAFPAPSFASLAAGGVVALMGLTLRTWASSYLIGTATLVISGPFRFLRHPTGLGSLALAFGIGLASGEAIGAMACLVLGGLYVTRTAEIRDRVNESRYGDRFRVYRSMVPNLIPQIVPADPEAVPPRSLSQGILSNDMRELRVILLAMICFSLLACPVLGLEMRVYHGVLGGCSAVAFGYGVWRWKCGSQSTSAA